MIQKKVGVILKYVENKVRQTYTITVVEQETVYGDCRDCIYYDDYFHSAGKYVKDNAAIIRSGGMSEYQKATIEDLEDNSYCEWSGENFYSFGFSHGYGSTCDHFKSRWGEKEVTKTIEEEIDNTPDSPWLALITGAIGAMLAIKGIISIFVGSYEIFKLIFGILLFISVRDDIPRSFPVHR